MMRARRSRSGRREESQEAWLKNMQFNSWEAELLVSALTLYALFQIPEVIGEYASINFEPDGNLFLLSRFTIGSIGLLQMGFTVHIILRSIWVANLGLSYVYPSGLDLRKLRLKGRFLRELEGKEKHVDYVLKLERLASLTYATSFLLFGTLFSALLVFVLFGVLNEYVVKANLPIDKGVGSVVYFTLLFSYLLIILLLTIDFLTNGLFRRKKWAAWWFYPIAATFRFISLSFIYRRSYLTLLSNLPVIQRRILPFAIILLFVVYLSLSSTAYNSKMDRYYQTQGTMMNPGHYESLRHEDMILVATIPDEFINASFIKLFLKPPGKLENFFSYKNGNDWDNQSLEKQKEWLREHITLTIDGSANFEYTLEKTIHPKEFQEGFYFFISVANLENGRHLLELNLNDPAAATQQFQKYDDPILASIPFYTDRL